MHQDFISLHTAWFYFPNFYLLHRTTFLSMWSAPAVRHYSV